MEKSQPFQIKTISDFHRLLGAPAPEHPLISIIKIEPFEHIPEGIAGSVINGFYSISLKKGFKSPVKFKYGQQTYDFDEGVLSFMSPGQIGGFDPQKFASPEQTGWLLLFHPDLLWNTALARKIKTYDFFDYAVNEALFLSDKEEVILNQILDNISREYQNNLDKFSHDIMITQIDSLLNYSERFYQRQFLTRRKTNHQLLDRLNEQLIAYFEEGHKKGGGLPTVGLLAEELNVSPDYLSGLLKTLTGMSTQQHIHEKLIERAKLLLSTTNLSVSEIAYQLGFEHSQSFSKLFKAKNSLSPLAFRTSFN
ncbi:helix-turn-helix transcriptional regulator [Pedobacter sp. MR2016-19]|uniref:helix-turn-helix domain-containing protein n=1 Tax=Pedobacter sp. MR2016-19 TaxID=2780089 RepID=UPI00187553E2|nr:response regulator transcription factor [Pedobacter sp. MR2016-19]MBE5320336.1 helix-turn-helix transcriptional regulator [Pedobacter sp. MR2016-19]